MQRLGGTFEKWRSSFLERDRCPWPGPRPLTRKDDEQSLIGRDRDARDFVTSVQQHRLVVLAGESGVGKTSLLSMSLVRRLRDEGYTTFVCRTWSATSTADGGFDDFIRERLNEDMSEDAQVPQSADVLGFLDEEYGDRCVLILDQFEELIRFNPDFYNQAAAWILKANRHRQVKIILSLRLEYRHMLRHLDHNAAPFSMTSITLEPLHEERHIRSIISNGPIKSGAADQLFNVWRVGTQNQAVGSRRFGLLHLQAVLYVLHSRLGLAEREIDESDLEDEFGLDSHDAQPSPQTVTNFFRSGLERAVEVKLLRCEESCREIDLDETLIVGTRVLVNRMAPHLSSGGYKLERESWELARQSLLAELEHLTSAWTSQPDTPQLVGRSPSQNTARALFEELQHCASRAARPDFLEIRLQELAKPTRNSLAEVWASEVEAPLAQRQRMGEGYFPWHADPRHASAGWMFGMPPVHIALEEVRRAVFAQQWLVEAQIVRSSAVSIGKDSQVMLSLIHDGYGLALERLRDNKPFSEPQEAIHAITAVRGVLDWKALVDSQLDPLRNNTLVNLRWRDCQILADFENITFINCDFRGSRFQDCMFRGVEFVNCMLDNVTFEDCNVEGTPEDVVAPGPTASKSRYPSFTFPGSEQNAALVRSLMRYRGLTSHGKELRLFSRTSGMPALPSSESDVTSHEKSERGGGLVMYGGRLSSLMFKNCASNGGKIALRFVAGSSLDMVDTIRCDLEISYSAIRGLTVTQPVIRREAEGRLHLTAHETYLANAWLGDGWQGTGQITKSKVLQLLNLSPQLDLRLHDCWAFGVANAVLDQSTLVSAEQILELVKASRLTEDMQNMDFRPNPAEELELRRVQS